MIMNQDDLLKIRIHLQTQSKDQLLDLISELLQKADQETVAYLRSRLSPAPEPQAPWRYDTAEAFLEAVEQFAQEVAQRIYYDEEALEYFGEDPVDREYHMDRYGLYEDFDPDSHEGLNKLHEFFDETNLYFEAKEYGTAAQAYDTLIYIVSENPEDTIGIYSPIYEINETEEGLGQKYFLALKKSQPANFFYSRALNFLTKYDKPYQRHMENFMAVVGQDGAQKLQAHLESWVDTMMNLKPLRSDGELPYRLQLLFKLYEEHNQSAAATAARKRLRHVYLKLYHPLIDAQVASGDWAAVVAYGEELLQYLAEMNEKYSSNIYYRHHVDDIKIREQIIQAHEALGQPQKALDTARPLFIRSQTLANYARVKRLLTEVDPAEVQPFVEQTLAQLHENLTQKRYFLSQIYLFENRFDEAFALVEKEARYNTLGSLKLVSKAHLLVGLGYQARPEMGENLQQLYAKVQEGSNEATLLLRDYMPEEPMVERQTAVARAEQLYQQIMQIHIDNGRKTYSTAAYYCALLQEIAVFDGRAAEFEQFYEALLGRYSRHRALKRELGYKVK